MELRHRGSWGHRWRRHAHHLQNKRGSPNLIYSLTLKLSRPLVGPQKRTWVVKNPRWRNPKICTSWTKNGSYTWWHKYLKILTYICGSSDTRYEIEILKFPDSYVVVPTQPVHFNVFLELAMLHAPCNNKLKLHLRTFLDKQVWSWLPFSFLLRWLHIPPGNPFLRGSAKGSETYIKGRLFLKVPHPAKLFKLLSPSFIMVILGS